MPLVSVIIPNYNHGNFLEQRINSILNQSLQDFEIIILDDFSTDESKTVIERFREQTSKISAIVFNATNSGSTFIQWARGLAMAKGKYIWIAESDDWSEISFLEEMVAHLEADDNVVLSHCQSLVVGTGGKIMDVGKAKNYYEKIDGKTYLNENMLGYNSIYNASMAVFRASAFSNISKRYMEMKYCGDWMFWSEIVAQGFVVSSGKVLNYYRKGGRDVTSSSVSNGLLFIESESIFQFIVRKTGVSIAQRSYIFDFRVREYFKNEPHFESDDIKKKVITSLLKIDPEFKMHLMKFKIKHIFNRMFSIS